MGKRLVKNRRAAKSLVLIGAVLAVFFWLSAPFLPPRSGPYLQSVFGESAPDLKVVHSIKLAHRGDPGFLLYVVEMPEDQFEQWKSGGVARAYPYADYEAVQSSPKEFAVSVVQECDSLNSAYISGKAYVVKKGLVRPQSFVEGFIAQGAKEYWPGRPVAVVRLDDQYASAPGRVVLSVRF